MTDPERRSVTVETTRRRTVKKLAATTLLAAGAVSGTVGAITNLLVISALIGVSA